MRAQSGAVDRVLIKKDALDYIVCSYMTLTPVWGDESSRVLGFIRVYRTSPDNLKAEVVLENYGNATVSYPAMNFKIKVTSFRPPNVF